MAMKVACLMLTASISAAVEKPTATASARAMIASNSFSRASGVKSFESLRPRGRFCGSRMTAAAATGPASGPRPASSTPATGQTPRFKSRRSMRKSGLSIPWLNCPWLTCLRLSRPRFLQLRPGESGPWGRRRQRQAAGARAANRPSAQAPAGATFRPRPCIICDAAVRGERAPPRRALPTQRFSHSGRIVRRGAGQVATVYGKRRILHQRIKRLRLRNPSICSRGI